MPRHSTPRCRGAMFGSWLGQAPLPLTRLPSCVLCSRWLQIHLYLCLTTPALLVRVEPPNTQGGCKDSAGAAKSTKNGVDAIGVLVVGWQAGLKAVRRSFNPPGSSPGSCVGCGPPSRQQGLLSEDRVWAILVL
ncbi:hypothetical protein NDU88_003722 [Pleurodeles waltl]|uniref:Uncharacterized protein n=1 Tax=Pleurodeles waltl TaxID=8319 RepID=A0AAV7W6Y9_PLEWA|nr:hypothetical protein NDU88_003722 [Pleurodeles waltl]